MKLLKLKRDLVRKGDYFVLRLILLIILYPLSLCDRMATLTACPELNLC